MKNCFDFNIFFKENKMQRLTKNFNPRIYLD
jgi:hypothetical protein